MEYKNVLIFGGTGALGKALGTYFNGNNVRLLDSKSVNFNERNYSRSLDWILNANQPDVIINAAGVFYAGFDLMFAVNVQSSWNIMEWYRNNPPQKPTIFQMIGSSSYDGPRKDYPLYAASKAALHSLYLSSREIFAGTNFHTLITHPPKLNGGMGDEDGEPVDTIAKIMYSTIINEYRRIA